MKRFEMFEFEPEEFLPLCAIFQILDIWVQFIKYLIKLSRDVLSEASRLSVTSASPQVHPSCSGSQRRSALPWHLPPAPGTGELHGF